MRALLLFAFTACAHVPGYRLPPEAEVHEVLTGDGATIELVRYRAQGEATGLPVLLCHGIGANGRNMDMDDRISMARWFAGQGREAWTLSLRGTGNSRAPDGPTYFDHYWREDLPAAIAHVQRVSGADELNYAGHSMGGMVLYAYLAEGGRGIAAAATLASPTRFDFGGALEPLLKSAEGLLPADASIPTPLFSGFLAPLEYLWDDSPLERFFYVPGNTSTATFDKLLRYGTAPIAGGVAQQFGRLFDKGEFKSHSGVLDFRADMGRITTPVLVVAGRLDRIGVAPAVKDGYRALGGPKEWLLISRANGSATEYGHMDFVLGERAAGEVWSKVKDFFDRHARREHE